MIIFLSFRHLGYYWELQFARSQGVLFLMKVLMEKLKGLLVRQRHHSFLEIGLGVTIHLN